MLLLETVDGETLLTVTCETEKIINDRPLTRKCDDPRDFSVLTPNTILLCYLDPCNQPCESLPCIIPDQITGGSKHRRWPIHSGKSGQGNTFPALQERQRWLYRKPNLVSGDLVLIKDQDQPRGEWPLGLADETFPDSQGCVRQVVVRTANQKR